MTPSHRRLAATLAALVAWYAAAHVSDIPHDLRGVRFCVDPGSVDVSFERGGEVAVRAVRGRLEPYLVAALGGAGVPWVWRESCRGTTGYVHLALHVATDEDFAWRASRYQASVRVGPWREGPDGRPRAEPPDAFDFFAADVFDERAVGVPAVVFLPRYLEAGVRDLTASWWYDRLEAEETRAARARNVVGVVGTLALGVLGLAVITRWRRHVASRLGAGRRFPSR